MAQGQSLKSQASAPCQSCPSIDEQELFAIWLFSFHTITKKVHNGMLRGIDIHLKEHRP